MMVQAMNMMEQEPNMLERVLGQVRNTRVQNKKVQNKMVQNKKEHKLHMELELHLVGN